MKLRLYCDEDSMDQALIRALEARAVDVESALTAGMIRRSDEAQLEYAAAEGRAIYSFNVGHFCRLHSDFMEQGKSHGGIILTQQQRLSVGEQLRRLLKIIGALSAEDMKGRLEFLSSW